MDTQQKWALRIGPPVVALLAFVTASWLDGREEKRVDTAEIACLKDNECKRSKLCDGDTDLAKAMRDGGILAEMSPEEIEAWLNDKPRTHAISGHRPVREWKPRDWRTWYGSSPEECQRPDTTDRSEFTGALGALLCVPWGIWIAWSIFLYAVRSLAKAIRGT